MGDHFDDALNDDDFIDIVSWERLYIKECFEKRLWVQSNMEAIPLNRMSTGHVERCVAFIERGASAYGMADKWLPVLKEELEKRKGP